MNLKLLLKRGALMAAANWQTVAIQDDKLAEMIADSVKRNLPKSPTQWQDALEKQLKGLSLPTP